MDSGLSWPAFASCALVLCISLGLTLCAVSGCCRRRREDDSQPVVVVARPFALWVAVAHPGGETSVGCHRFPAKACPA